jgi:tetratricopeptide (TPR) repeat protein
VKAIDEGVFGDSRPPWIDFFAESPVKALDELFTNAYYHGTLNVVEPEDLLLDWATAIDSESFNEMLDSSIAKWIEQRWNDNSSVGNSIGLMWQRALRVTALLDTVPHKAIDALYLRRPTAISHLGPLIRNRACDPLGWYWASVSRAQVGESLVRQWFRLCKLVPGTPIFHGPWGLLGLQRVPGTDQGSFRIRVASGLEQYLRALEIKVQEQSLGRREAERFALSATQDLSRRYPFPNRWREYWSGNGDADLPSLVRRWVTMTWGTQAFRPPAHKQRRDWLKQRNPAEWAGKARELAVRLRRSDDRTAKRDAEIVLDAQRSYALDTGNSYYIVRTLCQFSFILANRDNRTAAVWAEEAIDWEPWNAYCWSAMIAAKRAARDIEEAIRLSFEAIDRFPNDAVARNGLAEVLRAAGRLEEAQAVYQETINRFPNDAYARTGLAGVLRAAARAQEVEAGLPDTVEQVEDDAADLEVLHAAAPAQEVEAGLPDTVEQVEDDAAEPNAESYASPRLLLRANIRRALLFKGQERHAFLQRLIAQADDLLKVNSYDVDALYTKAEALLALESYTGVDNLLTSLPQYIAERPDFQAIRGRLLMARLVASRPQPFDPSIVQSVVTSWDAASKSAAELRGVATVACLRAAATMVDGASLHELQESATADVSRLISRQSNLERTPQNTANLTAWWLTAVRHAVMANSTGEELTYEEIAPRLEQHASFLDSLDGELVGASRYVYAPK